MGQQFWTGSPTPTSMESLVVEARGPEPSWQPDYTFRDGPIACQGINERVDWRWPLGGSFLGDPADPSGPTELFLEQDYWEADLQWQGSGDFQYVIRGFILDSVGAGVGNAWVGLYRSSDEQFIRSTWSQDSSGQYELRVDDMTTPYYLVAYRTGPDIEGTTVNTLVGQVPT